MAQSLCTLRVRQAIREIKSFEWEGDYRPAAREAIKQILEREMSFAVDRKLEEIDSEGRYDRRNGYFERHLLTEVGDIVLSVQRTRTFSATGIIKAYARRPPHVDKAILDCFLLGASTRKVGKVMASILGETLSPSTVSRIAKQLDRHVKAYHFRPLQNRYRFLLFDGVVLKRKTGAGARKKVVLVALGILPDGRKEVIDFFMARAESKEAWESFLNDLYRRGLTGEGVDLIGTDGGKGLIHAIGWVYPRIPLQRCWAHKTRNIVNAVKKADRQAVKRSVHKISHAKNLWAARSALKAFVKKWQKTYPKAVEKVIEDIDSLLAFFKIKEPDLWGQIRTTNAIERRFVEVRRRTRPMGVFSDNTSMERILYAVFTYENRQQGVEALFSLTQNS